MRFSIHSLVILLCTSMMYLFFQNPWNNIGNTLEYSSTLSSSMVLLFQPPRSNFSKLVCDSQVLTYIMESLNLQTELSSLQTSFQTKSQIKSISKDFQDLSIIFQISIKISSRNASPFLIDSKPTPLLGLQPILQSSKKSKNMSRHSIAQEFPQSIPSKLSRLMPLTQVMVAFSSSMSILIPLNKQSVFIQEFGLSLS